MAEKSLSRRKQIRQRKKFPIGMFVALLTAVVVTLIGVLLGLDPSAILIRASASSIGLGFLVSTGLGVVRMADGEHKRRRQSIRQS